MQNDQGTKPRYYGLTLQLDRTSLHTGHVRWGYLWNNFQKFTEESSKSICCQPWMEPTVTGHHGLCCGIISLDPEPTRGPSGAGISNLLIALQLLAGPGSYSCATAGGPQLKGRCCRGPNLPTVWRYNCNTFGCPAFMTIIRFNYWREAAGCIK